MNSHFLRYQSSGSGSGNDIPRRGSGMVKWERVETNTGLDLTVCKLREFNSYEMYVGKELCVSVKQGVIKIGDANVKNGVIGGIRPSWENHGRDGFILFKQTGLLPQGKLMIGTDCAGMISSHGGLLDFLIGLIVPRRRIKYEPYSKISFDKDRICGLLAICILFYLSGDDSSSVPD